MAYKQSVEITEDYLYVNSDVHASSSNSMNMVFENVYSQYKLLHDYLKETNQNEELVVQFIIDHQTTQHIHLYNYFIGQKIRVRLVYKEEVNVVLQDESIKNNVDTCANYLVEIERIDELIEKEKYRFENHVRKKSPKFKLQLIINCLIRHRKDRKKLQVLLLNETRRFSSIQN